MRLLVVDGRTYLEGWCRRAEGVRLFRLDRMLSVDVLDVPAEVPESAEPVDVDAGLFRASPSDVLVELELGPAARWVAESYPCETVTELGDGRLRIGLRTPDTGWLRRLALQSRRGRPRGVPAGAGGRGQVGRRRRARPVRVASTSNQYEPAPAAALI